MGAVGCRLAPSDRFVRLAPWGSGVSDTYDRIVAACGGHVLASSPVRGWDAADGTWELVRYLPTSVKRRLIGAGMMGREVRRDRPDPRWRLRGAPTGPDGLAWAITEAGMVPAAHSSSWDAGQAVEWYVAAVLAVQDGPITDRDGPDYDPLPTWATDWLDRLVCPVKRAYATDAVRSVYWQGWPAPADEGRSWEADVWAKISRRYNAEQDRYAARLERAR